jgi:hypothetical protein
MLVGDPGHHRHRQRDEDQPSRCGENEQRREDTGQVAKNVEARKSRIPYTPARLRSVKIHSGYFGWAERGMSARYQVAVMALFLGDLPVSR